MTHPSSNKIIIIGSGPAGYTAAIYAARAGLSPLLFEGLQPGGQMTITTDVENYPGFAEVIQGPWLMEQMRAQALQVGTRIINNIITKVDFTKKPFICYDDDQTSYTSKTVIICTGAQAKWLGLEGETKYRGFGVSACATCDGFFFKNKKVCVIGGGNTAVEEALFLTHHAAKVILIHRRNQLRAEKILQERLFKHPKIDVMWDSVVIDVKGTENPLTVSQLEIKNLHTNYTHLIDTDGVFIAIGHEPSTKLFDGQLDLDSEGYILTKPDSTATSIPGIFAAGDVKDKIFRQAITAAGMGCMAALEADKYLARLSL
ncbi:MAG: thioredoxin-disulfide reductase [Alphaproteobacteria bacterium]|nr:thioredoxin-disulfide reductase [Alphaproteobacteria bacterium]